MFSNFNAKAPMRLFVPAIALALVGCSSQSNPLPTVHAAGPTGIQNILLVHGAWSDGSVWNPLISGLTADGYNVTAVQLPFTSLADDVATVQRALAREPGKTLLVAHSYGGIVITQAGNDPKVGGLVYVAAYAPDNGESVLSLNGQVPATPIMGDLQQDSNGYSIKELRVLAERWRVQYNTIRPHSSLGYRPPAPEAWLTNSMGHGEVETATRFRLLHTPTAAT